MSQLVVSSALNKSGRTFAPKAQARRRNAAPPAESTSSRASVERGTGSQSQTPAPNANQAPVQASIVSSAAEPLAEDGDSVEQILPTSEQIPQTQATPNDAGIVQKSQQPTPESTPIASTAITRPSNKHASLPHLPSLPSVQTISTPKYTASRVSDPEAILLEQSEPDSETARESAGPTEPTAEAQDEDEAAIGQGKRKQRKGKRKVTDEVEIRTRKRRARSNTPEDGERFEISTSSITMAELCNDMKTGQKSKQYRKLLDAEAAEKNRRKLKRQRQALEDLEAQAQEAAEAGNPEGAMRKLEQKVQAQEARIRNTAPQMRVVNGLLVVDEQSLTLDRHAVSAAEHERMDVVEEDEFTRKVNSGTWKIKKYTHRGWNGEATEKFYEALRTFGTDFTMIGMMLGRDRRECRMKFNKEERLHPKRVNDAILGKRLPINLGAFDEEFGDPAEFDAELERIEQEHAKSLAQAEEEMRKDREAQEQAARQGTAGGGGEDGEQNREPIEVQPPGLRKKKGKDKKKFATGKQGRVDDEEIVGKYDDVMAERAALAEAQKAKEAAETVVR